MKNLWQDLWKTSLRLMLLGGALIAAIGCATNLDSSLHAAVGADHPLTAEEHLLAAGLYDQESQSQAKTALQYERRADTLSPYMDPKGFRRAGLMTAAQEHRRNAAHLQQLHVFHQSKGLALTGQVQPQ
ncbi:MAG: hypothetical protein ABI945_10705 [Nitrospirales bacterium]